MKRLLEEAEPTLGALTTLVASAERHQSSPFAKRHVQSRLARALAGGSIVGRRRHWRPALLAVGGLLVAATAAAAGYTLLASSKPAEPAAPVVAVAPPREVQNKVAHPAPLPPPSSVEPTPEVESPSAKRADKPRAGEDPSQVAEAVRALRKQGDAARAQQLLDQYLRANPRGALAEDALALSIEAAAARKDPRAADYARRYLARYPNGRFRSVAERALAR
jgi:type IV secretory pathway VirB10-like protein